MEAMIALIPLPEEISFQLTSFRDRIRFTLLCLTTMSKAVGQNPKPVR
jgi:hypothetical protein